MLCRKCINKEICSIYKLKKHHIDNVNMLINSCKYIVYEKKTEEPKAEENKNIFKSVFNEKEYKDLVDRMNNKETKEEKDIKVTCKSCGGVDYASEISYCSKCGKEVCGNCSTSEKGLIYCNECWGGI